MIYMLPWLLRMCDQAHNSLCCICAASKSIGCQMTSSSTTIAFCVRNRYEVPLQGTLPALVKVLPSPSKEAHVSALLCRGMLVGDSQEHQVQLANVDAALSHLLELRLQRDDEDCRQIADGIVAALVR